MTSSPPQDDAGFRPDAASTPRPRGRDGTSPAAPLPPPSASVTDWDVIHDARGDGASARRALDRIARRYWPAVYAYLRRTGCDAESAADLTQGFLCDVVVDGDLIERADPVRGRFRTYLYTSLRNYLVQRHRHAQRRRRHPGTPVRALGPSADTGQAVAAATLPDDPARAFTTEWARGLVRAAIDRAASECAEDGLEPHWAVFEHRVARPLLEGTTPRDYADLVAELDLEDAAQAANMMITAKRRFARVLRDEIGRTLASPAEVDAEIRDLLAELGARP